MLMLILQCKDSEYVQCSEDDFSFNYQVKEEVHII